MQQPRTNSRAGKIREEYERVVHLSEQSIKPDLYYGELRLDLSERSLTDVRREANRWGKFCVRPRKNARFKAADLALIESAGSARRLAEEWAAAAADYVAFVSSAYQDADRRTLLCKGILTESRLALKAVRCSEAANWVKALDAALRLQSQEWRPLVRLIKHFHNRQQKRSA